jgi:6-phosphogluconolactonase
MSLKNIKWQSFESQASLDRAAMARVESLSESSIEARGQFHLVLAGGSTPKNVYTLLKNISYRLAVNGRSILATSAV